MRATGHQRSDEVLQALADGDVSAIGTFAQDPSQSRKAAGLTAETVRVAEIVALAAVDASPMSWFAYLGSEHEDDALHVDTIVAALVAVAPIVGAPRIVSAAANILGAAELAEEIGEES